MTERNDAANLLATGLVGAVVSSALAVPFLGFLPLAITAGGIVVGALAARALIAASEKEPVKKAKDDDKEDDVFDW